MRPANWWDDIGFGHQDAYSNALAYHALVGMAEMARRAHQPDDAQLYAVARREAALGLFRYLLQSRHGSAGRVGEAPMESCTIITSCS